MDYSLDLVQDDIVAYVKSVMPQPLHETAIADADTVRKNPKTGAVETYIAYQLGDLQDGYSPNIAGVQNNDYEMPVYFQVVSPHPDRSRKIANRLLEKLLGYTPAHASGQLRKKPGGGMFPITSSNGATEAYQFPVSFTVTLQLIHL